MAVVLAILHKSILIEISDIQILLYMYIKNNWWNNVVVALHCRQNNYCFLNIEMWLYSNVINIMYSVSSFQSFLYNSNSHKGYTCMCIVTSIGWSICTLTGLMFMSKSMSLARVLRFKMLNFHGNLAWMLYVDNDCLHVRRN